MTPNRDVFMLDPTVGDIPNLGVRCRRFSMLVDNGVVKSLNIEEPKKFEVSDAHTMLKQAG